MSIYSPLLSCLVDIYNIAQQIATRNYLQLYTRCAIAHVGFVQYWIKIDEQLGSGMNRCVMIVEYLY